MADKIKLLPISDNPNAGDFAKAIIEQLAATFGLTFEQLNGRTVGRVNRFHTGGVVKKSFDRNAFKVDTSELLDPRLQPLREATERKARAAMDVYRREYESICAVYLIGYDPQRLLEDKR